MGVPILREGGGDAGFAGDVAGVGPGSGADLLGGGEGLGFVEVEQDDGGSVLGEGLRDGQYRCRWRLR